MLDLADGWSVKICSLAGVTAHKIPTSSITGILFRTGADECNRLLQSAPESLRGNHLNDNNYYS